MSSTTTQEADGNDRKRQKLEEEPAKKEVNSNVPALLLTRELFPTILSYLKVEQDGSCEAWPLRVTCRHFAEQIDWELIIRNCHFNARGFIFGVDMRYFWTLYQKYKTEFVTWLLANPSFQNNVLSLCQMLTLAVHQNDAVSVGLLLNVDMKPEVEEEGDFDVGEPLRRALRENKTEIANIFLEHPRGKRSIRKCEKCNVDPGCHTCRCNDIFMTTFIAVITVVEGTCACSATSTNAIKNTVTIRGRA